MSSNTINHTYPDFSVLMSVYAKEQPHNLDQALHSIEHQTVLPKEIVLVEDGPLTGALVQVIKQHVAAHDGLFNIVRSKDNHGLGHALRLGTPHVSTDWIARMDSDDYSVHDRFESQLKAIAQHPDLAVIGGQIKEFAGTIDNVVGMRKVPTDYELIKDFLKWRSPFNHPTVMINKQALLDVGGYTPYGNLEDYYLWARLILKNYPVQNLPETLIYMRADKGMYSRRGNVKNLHYFYKLRHYMKSQGALTMGNEIIGDLMMTANITLPNGLRKIIYRKILHRK